MIRLRWRALGSPAAAFGAPVVALAITVVSGAALFALLGKPPGQALALFFVEPLRDARGWSELSVKATPLILIGLGLAVAFRASVWNIGAEGQFIAGALIATAIALTADDHTGRGVWVAIVAGGAVGGALWAAVVAALRDRFGASEILVSLMLVYVAELLLGYLVYGPWKDPHGYNFPQTASFAPATAIPLLASGYRAHVGVAIALAGALATWLFVFRSHAGFQLEVGGVAPRAARYAGFSARRALWTALLVSGATAGVAGALEVAGPIGQLTPHFPVGYGFAAIIVAFVGRLHPFGVVLAALLMSMFYIGGELVQSRLGLPRALTGVFQGMLLFALLACDAVWQRWQLRAGRAAPTVEVGGPSPGPAPEDA
ncbi:MAG TPA: ABC transporter permease [Kofleriaceae bacterium]|nr:ABC transporter permease [Kofleriaceae bacterium]